MELDMTESNAAWLERIGQVQPVAEKPAPTPTKKEEE